MPKRSETGVRGLFKDGEGRYVIDHRYRDSKGVPRRYRERLPVGTPAAAAKRRATDVLAAALAGMLATKGQRPWRLAEAFKSYGEWLAVNRPGAVKDRSYHAKAIVKVLGDRALNDLAPFDLERLKKALKGSGKDTRSEATVNRHMATLKHMLGVGADLGWVRADLAHSLRRVKLLREPPGRRSHLSADEEKRLFEALPADLVPLVTVAIRTGTRLGELKALRWSDVNLETGHMTIAQSKSNRPRTVPMNAVAKAALVALRAKADKNADYVFLTRSRKPYTKASTCLSKRFELATTKAKIENFHFHDLRHHFATTLRRQGVGLDAIARLLGHATLQMASRYANIDDVVLWDAVTKAG